MVLKPGTALERGKYRIDTVLGQGGFGITYLGEQIYLGRKVAIKEFFMDGVCVRDESTQAVTAPADNGKGMVERFRRKFIKEAQNIARLKHRGIVPIIDIFEENGTAYYVMEHLSGGSLSSKVHGGALPQETALRYIRQVAAALGYVHAQRMMHLDIKPANILIDDEDNAVLIDFGLSKKYDSAGQQTSTTPVGISHGYAPLEQYKQGGVEQFTPATDVYSLGATLYKLVTGATPPEASDVMNMGLPAFPPSVSPAVQKTITAAMQPAVMARPQSIGEFMRFIDGGAKTVKTKETVADIPVLTEREKPHNKPSFNIKLVAMIAAAMMFCVVVAVFGVKLYNDYQAAETEREIAEERARLERERQGIYTVNGVEFKMVLVKGGTFQMGATSEQQGNASDERPVHSVTLSDYYIGETEVTQALWQAVMGNNPSGFTGNSQRPVEKVSWNDCRTFISRLNEKTGMNFRLPTEAEWEYAARGGNRSNGTQYSGSSNISNVAWYTSNSGSTTHPVKSKSPNELGLYDMSGNVWEWCNDWYSSDYYSNSPSNNPKGPSSGSHRVLRGGSWDINAGRCRVAFRGVDNPGHRYGSFGLRLAL